MTADRRDPRVREAEIRLVDALALWYYDHVEELGFADVFPVLAKQYFGVTAVISSHDDPNATFILIRGDNVEVIGEVDVNEPRGGFVPIGQYRPHP